MMSGLLASIPGITDKPLPILDPLDESFYSVDPLVLPPYRLQQISDKEELSCSEEKIEPVADPRINILLDSDVWKQIVRILTPWQSIIFEMYYIHEFTQTEIARALNIKAGQSSISHTLDDCHSRLKGKLTALEGLI